MRYRETGELHLDFHGAVNTTINYIAERFGETALTMIFNRMSKEVYKSIRSSLLKNDPTELIEHLTYFFDREHGEYSMTIKPDIIVLEVKKCPAVAQIRKLGLELSPFFCRQTIDVNNALCEGTSWQCETDITGTGTCRQTFSRRK